VQALLREVTDVKNVIHLTLKPKTATMTEQLKIISGLFKNVFFHYGISC